MFGNTEPDGDEFFFETETIGFVMKHTAVSAQASAAIIAIIMPGFL